MLQSLSTKVWRHVLPSVHPKSSNSLRVLFCQFYAKDAKEENINVSLDSNTGIATVTMQKAPVNSLDLEFLQALRNTIVSLEEEKCRGFILTSGMKTVYTGGLDIMEIYKPKPDRFTQFWTALQDLWLKLYTTPLATVAVINGHSPAGGCLFATSCDYRVMVGPNFRIGLNETQLGIVAPKWFMLPLASTLSNRQTELALFRGTLFTTEEALKLGIIDETASNKEEAMEKGLTQMKKFLAVPDKARGMTKVLWRQPAVDYLLANRTMELEEVSRFVGDRTVQKRIGMYLMYMKLQKIKGMWRRVVSSLMSLGRPAKSKA